MGDDHGFWIVVGVMVVIVFLVGTYMNMIWDSRWAGYAQGWCTHAQGTLIERKCVLKDGQIVEPKP